MSNPEPEDFEDVVAAMQDLQARIDKVAELAPGACEDALDDAYLDVNSALNTWHNLQSAGDPSE